MFVFFYKYNIFVYVKSVKTVQKPLAAKGVQDEENNISTKLLNFFCADYKLWNIVKWHSEMEIFKH